jgi:hypothetical protein
MKTLAHIIKKIPLVLRWLWHASMNRGAVMSPFATGRG